MIRLSIPFRQALARLTLPVMLMFSLCLILIGRADQNLQSELRAGLDDLLAPAYGLVSGPVSAIETGGGAGCGCASGRGIRTGAIPARPGMSISTGTNSTGVARCI